MKKRGIVIAAMLLLSIVLFCFAKVLQKSTVDDLTGIKVNGSKDVSVSLNNNEKDINKSETATADAGESISAAPEPSVKPSNADTAAVQQGQSTPKPTVSSSGKNQTNPTPTPEPVKPAEETFSLTIIDTTSNNRVILKKEIKCDGKTNLFSYTDSALKNAGIKKYLKSDGYVAMIDNLFDYPSMPDKASKDASWTSAGWIYYINGNKASFGSKGYNPKAGDAIQWKYWKDAVYEK